MKKTLLKKLALISVGLMLIGTAGSIVAPTVNAVSQKTYTKYSCKFNKVVALKPMQVYKVHPGKYACYNRYTKAYVLHPGDTAWVRHRGVDWGWTVGKSYRYCILKDNFSWFEGYEKYEWIDKGLLDGSMKDEHFSYKFTWEQFCKLCSLNVLNNNYSVTKKDWRTKIRPLIEKWKPETEKD